MLMGRLGRYFPGNKPMLGMDHFIFEEVGGGGGGQLPKKNSYTVKVEKKNTYSGPREKNRASLSTRRILLDQMKN